MQNPHHHRGKLVVLLKIFDAEKEIALATLEESPVLWSFEGKSTGGANKSVHEARVYALKNKNVKKSSDHESTGYPQN